MKLRLLVLAGFALQVSAQAQELAEREIHYRPGDWTSYPVMRFVTSIANDHSYVYFGTTSGIARYDFYRNRWDTPVTVSDGLADGSVAVVAYDFNTGFLWCATESGLNVRNPASDEWRLWPYEELGLESVTSMGTGDNYLWVQSGGSFFKGDRLGGMFWKASAEEEEEDRPVWYGELSEWRKQTLPDLFMGNGFLFFPDGIIQDTNLRRYTVTDFWIDDFQRLWMGTWGMGAGIADMRSFFLEPMPFGPYVTDIQSIVWDGNGMWIGGYPLDGESGGITYWNQEDGTWTTFESLLITPLRSDRVSAIAADENRVWFGTDEGLALYDKDRDRWRLLSIHDNLWDNRIITLAVGETFLWVGTPYGINRVHKSGLIVEKVEDKRLSHRGVYILDAQDGEVWAGTELGIFLYKDTTRTWEYIPGYAGMLPVHIKALSVYENEIWFGTDDGVEVLDRESGEWRGFPGEHYPTGLEINDILADSSLVWVGTEQGLLQYFKKEQRWRLYTTEDGLLDNSVRWLLPDGDYIWFATGMGLTRFFWNAPYRLD